MGEECRARRCGSTFASRLKTIRLMARLRSMYRKEVSVDEIARIYGEVR